MPTVKRAKDGRAQDALSLAGLLRDRLVRADPAARGQIEQDLRRLQRLASLGTLSASVAHEIKNALVAGRTFIDLLLEKHKDAELAELVRRELSRIESIVNQMLKFAGSAKPTFTPVRVHETLEHSLRLVQAQLDSKAITLNRIFQAGSDQVEGDECQLQQVFVNLFLNALEAMGLHGTLTVATELISGEHAPASLRDSAQVGQLRVTVRDTGAGIAPENVARLFEPFFTTKPSGTGLGLSITRRIIQEHGGDITLESQPNHGTTFSILLPTLDASQLTQLT